VKALASSGFKGPQVNKALEYIRKHEAEATDAYTLALCVNALVYIDLFSPEANIDTATTYAQRLDKRLKPLVCL
jgi:hypothetical protein